MSRLCEALDAGMEMHLDIDELIGHIRLNWEWYAPIWLSHSFDMTAEKAAEVFPNVKHMTPGSCRVIDMVDGELVGFDYKYVAVEVGRTPRVLLKLDKGYKCVVFKARNNV